MDFGWSGFQKRQKINSNFVVDLAKDVKSTIFVARVTDILLNNNNKENFSNLGEWNGIGTIRFETIDKRLQDFNGYAKPIDVNFKKFPLINELVYIISTYNTNETNNPYSINSFYISNIALWSHPHHNAYPFNSNIVPENQKKSYTQVEAGSTKKDSSESVSIDLGYTFKEKPNIHSLLPFEGDIIIDGRWDNSIRLGSTVKDSPNNWSKSGEEGDPILIINNGQGYRSPEGYIPIVENINNDNSSIYLTSTQQIPITVSSNNYESYSTNKTPISPNKYAGSQIILSSGRLVFNTRDDHMMLTSAKSINLNSKESINIDTELLSVKANNIYLGENSDYTNNEPLMLGKQTANLLKDLVQSLTVFMSAASTAATNVCVPGQPAVLPTINSAAQSVLDDLFNLNRALGSDPNLKDCNLTSKRNYTV